MHFRPLTGRTIPKRALKLHIVTRQRFRPLTGITIPKHLCVLVLRKSVLGFRPLTGRTIPKHGDHYRNRFPRYVSVPLRGELFLNAHPNIIATINQEGFPSPYGENYS